MIGSRTIQVQVLQVLLVRAPRHSEVIIIHISSHGGSIMVVKM